MRCAECGAPVADVTEACSECGAPRTGQRPRRAAPGEAGPGDSPAIVAAGVAGSVPARISLRGRYSISLSVFLILFIASWIGINKAPPRSGLSYTMGWIIVLSLAGALTSLVLLLRARRRREPSPSLRQGADRYSAAMEPVTDAAVPEDSRQDAAGLRSGSERLRMRCVECGALVAEAPQVCPECGGPSGRAAADDGPGGSRGGR